jgi:5-methylcytosine-specific restriction protein A
VTAAFAARIDAPDADSPDADRRTVPMIQADALAVFCAHVIGCEKRVPVAGATVIVRMSVEDLEAGTGSATVDGLDQPVSVGAARRMAAGGGIIPCVLGGDSEVLDWGREKRLFTRAQRLALVERDGGCAMCGLPPEMTKAHHIRWWKRDHGPTDLANGVLLCETCHHRIHDNGWEIRIDNPRVGGRVWFLPPRYVDPARIPRLGGRARFDIA